MIRLIVSDIDGTLTAEGSTYINPEYFDVIRQLKDKGVDFVAASGRNMVSIRKVLSPIIDEIWAIAENGAALIHGEDIIIPHPIPREWVRDLWQELSVLEEADSFVDAAQHTYAPFEDTPMYRFIRDGYQYDIHATGSWEQLPEETIVMMGLYHPVNAQAYYDAHLSSRWKTDMNYLSSGITWMNLNMPGVSKGSALQKLIRDLHIDPEEVICFGDNINDISMLKVAGTAMTVADARPEVRAVCHKIVPACSEDGVLQELKAILADF